MTRAKQLLGKQGRNHMTNMSIGSSIVWRCGLEQPQGGDDFWQAFSGAGFGMGVVRPERRMGTPAGDS